jgi:hypothetical protein
VHPERRRPDQAARHAAAPTTRTGAIWERPRPPASAGALAFAAWVWSFAVLAWHTVVDVAAFFATILFLRDPHTLFKRVSHGEHQRKRLVHRGLSLDDVKFVKNVMNCVSSINSLVFLSSISNFFAKTGMKSFHYCLKMTEMLHMSGQTVNDVLVGVTYAALSRYYFRNKGDDWQPYKNALF